MFPCCWHARMSTHYEVYLATNNLWSMKHAQTHKCTHMQALHTVPSKNCSWLALLYSSLQYVITITCMYSWYYRWWSVHMYRHLLRKDEPVPYTLGLPHFQGRYTCWCKISQNMTRLFRWNFHNFYFCGTNAWHSDHSPASWLPCPMCEPKKRHDTVQWSRKASMGNNGLAFLLCGGLHNYESIYQDYCHAKKLACWTERFSTADLDCDNFRASLTVSLVFRTVAGWFFSTATIYIEGRQTVKNHCIHTGASLYWHAHIMTSSISLWFLFLQKQVCLWKNCENLHPAKIYHCTVILETKTSNQKFTKSLSVHMQTSKIIPPK